MSAETAFIALGGNLPSRVGAPAQTLRAALTELGRSGISVEAISRFYFSPAWPDPVDPMFVNAVAQIRTRLSPVNLLSLLHATETAFGRTRSARNAPRTLDLDILDFGPRVEEGPPALPHPRMHDRAFVLIPLAEIAPGWRHPVFRKSVEELIAALPRPARDAVIPL